jgi:hypothetical protein
MKFIDPANDRWQAIGDVATGQFVCKPRRIQNEPPELKRAVIVHRGRLTPDYAYLEEYLPAHSGA